MENDDRKYNASSLGVDFNGSSYFRPKTKEEIQKESKGRRIERFIAGFSDGIRSLTNLFSAANYAPINYNHGKSDGHSLLETVNSRQTAEENDYNKKYSRWSKDLYDRANRIKEEAEKNKTVKVGGYYIKDSDWNNRDYIDDLYSSLLADNNEQILKLDAQYRYRREPIYDFKKKSDNYIAQGDKYRNVINFNGYGFVPTGEYKKIDMTNGKAGTYHKRAFIESLLGSEGELDESARQNISTIMSNFTNNKWKPLK